MEREGESSRSDQRVANIEKIRVWADAAAPSREKWRRRNAYFHKLDRDYLRFLISPGQKVLALGCGSGAKLACTEPELGVGVDISSRKINSAEKTYPRLTFLVGDMEDEALIKRLEIYAPFDVILLYDSLGFSSDIQKFLRRLKRLCKPERWYSPFNTEGKEFCG